MMNILTTTCLLYVTFCFVSPAAHAYFDPGTGSLIVQAIVGGFAGLAIYLFRIRIWIIGLIKKLTKRQ